MQCNTQCNITHNDGVIAKESRKQLKELPVANVETVEENKVILDYSSKENKYP